MYEVGNTVNVSLAAANLPLFLFSGNEEISTDLNPLESTLIEAIIYVTQQNVPEQDAPMRKSL